MKKIIWSRDDQIDPAFITHFEAQAVRGKPVSVCFTYFPVKEMIPDICRILEKECLFGGSMPTAEMAASSVRNFRTFVEFLIKDHSYKNRSISGIVSDDLERYEMHLSKMNTNANTASARFAYLLKFLRAARESIPLQASLVSRLAVGSVYVFGRQKANPLEPFSAGVEAQLRVAALHAIMAAEQRILKEGAELLSQGRDPEIHGWRRSADLMWFFHNRGHFSLPKDGLERFVRNPKYRAVKQRVYITLFEALAFSIIISLETGLPIECVSELKADCLQSEYAGSIGIRYVKRRKTGTDEPIVMRVPVGGPYSAVDCIKRALKLTETARRFAPDNYKQYLFLGIGSGTDIIPLDGIAPTVRFCAQYKIVDDEGHALKTFDRRRLRKTKIAASYKEAPQDANIIGGHSKDVHALHYASVEALMETHEKTIEDALNEAHRYAITIDPDVSDVSGDDVGVAACRDIRNPAHQLKNDQNFCDIPVWGCLLCKNAVVTESHLSAILLLLAEIRSQLSQMSLEVWASRFGVLHSQIVRSILPAFTPAQIGKARALIATDGLTMWLPPEKLIAR